MSTIDDGAEAVPMKIDRTSLRDRIADAVRLRIVSGELRPVLGWLRGATPEEVP